MTPTMVGIPAPVVLTPQQRKLFTQVYNGTAGTQRTYSPDFTRSLYTKLIFRLSGTLSKTESVAGSLPGEGPLPFIKGIRILGDGDLIKEIAATELRVLSHFVFRGVDTDLVNITLGTDVAEVFSARLELDFQALRTVQPGASWWDASRYNQISCEIDWGSSADLTGGGTYTGVTLLAQMDVFGEEILNPVARQNLYLVQKYQQKVFSVNAVALLANPFQLPVGESIRGILLSEYTVGPPRAPISTLVIAGAAIVIRITGPQGSYRKIETTWSELQQRNKATSQVAMPTGYAFIDLAEKGDIGEALRADSPGVTAVELLVDVASVANAFLQATLVTFKPGLVAPGTAR